MNVAGGKPWSPALNDSPDRVTVTYCTLQPLRCKFSNCSIIHSKCFLILCSLAALPQTCQILITIILPFFQSACARTAHKDHWSQGQNCWCCQEEELNCYHHCAKCNKEQHEHNTWEYVWYLYESKHDLDSSQLNEQPKRMKIQACLGSKPWPLGWLDTMLYPLS